MDIYKDSWPDGGSGDVAADQADAHIAIPDSLPGVSGGPRPALGVEWSTLHETLSVTNAPSVEIFTKKVGVPINVSGYNYIRDLLEVWWSYHLPLIHGSPSPRHPLIHNPLVVPDTWHVADAVKPITVGVSCPRHIDQSVNRKYFWIYLEHVCVDQYHISYHNYLELEQTEQLLPGDVV